MIKKADIILACVLVIAGLASSYLLSFGKPAGSEVVITCGGEKFASYSLHEDREVTVKQNGHLNKVTIKDSTVSMNFSDCSGQDCVHQHSISKSGESIICLPNKVVIQIKGKSDEYDSISK